jgi:hypothetical protein
MKRYVHYNIWIDNNTNKFGLIIFISTLISIVSINTKFFIVGVFLLILISIQAILRNKWNLKDIDMSDYFDLPEPGDIIVVTNPDKFNFHLESQTTYYGREVKIGDEFQITSVITKNKRVVINFRYEWVNPQLSFFDYYQTKKYWTTKSEIRDIKLKQLGI